MINRHAYSATNEPAFSDEFITSALYQHLASLLNRKSITPDDANCQQYLAEHLAHLGFTCRHIQINGVSNLVASVGNGQRRIAFAGHTDVVPPGDETRWLTPPFETTISQGKIFARGIADMKGGIACMLHAFAEVKHQLDLDNNQFFFLITSDEEGEADFGTKEIISYLSQRNLLPHLCIVGEPTASEKTGDVIKVGRRGAISGEITITGKQGHVAYPHVAENAAHGAAKLAYLLSQLAWDQGSIDFPGSSLQVTSIDTGSWTDNIIPGTSRISFNVRYSHNYQQEEVQQRVMALIDAMKCRELAFDIEWLRPCTPYFTDKESSNSELSLITAAEQAIYHVCHLFPRLSTSGGTSDGRFIASSGCQVIELGVPNTTIHQVNESVKIEDLTKLERIYQQLLLNLMAKAS